MDLLPQLLDLPLVHPLKLQNRLLDPDLEVPNQHAHRLAPAVLLFSQQGHVVVGLMQHRVQLHHLPLDVIMLHLLPWTRLV